MGRVELFIRIPPIEEAAPGMNAASSTNNYMEIGLIFSSTILRLTPMCVLWFQEQTST